MPDRELWAIEKELWTAGEDVFDQRLDAGAIMVCPAYGTLPRRTFLKVVRQQPCSEWARLSDMNGYSPFHDVAVLAYNVHAIKEGADYHAHCSSTYVRIGGDWRLAMHHQSQLVQPHGEATDSLGLPTHGLAARIFGALIGRLNTPESLRSPQFAARVTAAEQDAQRMAAAAAAARVRSRQA